MNADGQFVAQVLETSAAGYAGLAASLLLERHPEIAQRYEPDGFSTWKAQLQRWLIDLSAALGAGEPGLFETRMRWTLRAFVARQTPAEDLQAALAALRDILRERLPGGSADVAVPAIDRALEAVADPRAAEDADAEAHAPAGRPALAYLEAILTGKPRDAIAQVLGAVDGGSSARAVYLDVLIPALREVGRLWHRGELSIAEEHVITTTTQRAMALLCERARSSSGNGKTALLACVAGNAHDIGIRAAADLLEIAGWRTINLGADVPHDEIARGVSFFDADVVVLAATLDPHLQRVRRAIERIRALEERDVKIVVGGPAFARAPDLWRRIGADGYSAQVEDVEPLCARLTQS